MIKIPVVCSAWGGCGNLINNILHSPGNEQIIIKYYKAVSTKWSWSDQEFSLGPRPFIENVVHDYQPGAIFCGWRHSTDTTFHFLIKNPQVLHIKGNLATKHQAVLQDNRRLENKYKRTEYWQMDYLLSDNTVLIEQCQTVNPAVDQNTAIEIVELWREQTRKFYDKNQKRVLKKFQQVVPDYTDKRFSRLLDN